MFIDEATISVKAGSGGDGCTSFEKIMGKKYGRPSGGIGGKGGNVVIRADNNKQTLIDYRFNKHFKAGSGGRGGANNMSGLEGRECVISVPPGTLIKDAKEKLVLRDLVKAGDSVIIAKGGNGGRGNSPRREATNGQLGEEKELTFELKVIADVGIIGYPNAGKSTILSKVTSARPKIANFPFTTKSPNLGVAHVGDYSFIIADIPGLIEGAHEGKGLGDRFLRHIERTRLLVHVIDVSGMDHKDPCVSLSDLNRELALYSSELIKKKQIIVANKTDMPDSVNMLKVLKRCSKGKILEVSALTGKGLSNLLKTVAGELTKMNSVS